MNLGKGLVKANILMNKKEEESDNPNIPCMDEINKQLIIKEKTRTFIKGHGERHCSKE